MDIRVILDVARNAITECKAVSPDWSEESGWSRDVPGQIGTLVNQAFECFDRIQIAADGGGWDQAFALIIEYREIRLHPWRRDNGHPALPVEQWASLLYGLTEAIAVHITYMGISSK